MFKYKFVNYEKFILKYRCVQDSELQASKDLEKISQEARENGLNGVALVLESKETKPWFSLLARATIVLYYDLDNETIVFLKQR